MRIYDIHKSGKVATQHTARHGRLLLQNDPNQMMSILASLAFVRRSHLPLRSLLLLPFLGLSPQQLFSFSLLPLFSFPSLLLLSPLLLLSLLPLLLLLRSLPPILLLPVGLLLCLLSLLRRLLALALGRLGLLRPLRSLFLRQQRSCGSFARSSLQGVARAQGMEAAPQRRW